MKPEFEKTTPKPFEAERWNHLETGEAPTQDVRPWSVPNLTIAAKRAAERIVEEAHEDAQRIIGMAEARVAEAEQRAYRMGFEKGEDIGRQQMMVKMTPYLDHFRDLAREAVELRETQLRELEPEIYALALDIAVQVVHAEIETNESVVLSVARASIEQAAERESITLRISPDDESFLEEHRSELLTIEGVKKIRIESDPRVDSGGCIVETVGGEIDGRIESQLEQYESADGVFDA